MCIHLKKSFCGSLHRGIQFVGALSIAAYISLCFMTLLGPNTGT